MIIIGGGIVGCSIAYHLAHMGITDVLLLDQNQLPSGTTWHAAGLVGQLRASQNMTRLAQYTTELFQSLSVETGLETGYQRTGSFTLALDVERLEELKRQATMARAFGVQTSPGLGRLASELILNREAVPPNIDVNRYSD